MTASEIIAEIEALPPQGKEQVVRFVRGLDTEERLSGSELALLAEKLADSTDEAEALELRSALEKGFYGSK